MPATHVALLRGINVGTAKRVPMADLRQAIESLGATGVRTLLNSGNVVFNASGRAPTAAQIQHAVQARTGVDARVTVLGAKAWRGIVDGNPLLDCATDPSRLLVLVTASAADAAALKTLIDSRDWGTDNVALHGRVAYLWCADGILVSPLGAALLGRAMKDRVTSRNWATVVKLDAMLRADA